MQYDEDHYAERIQKDWRNLFEVPLELKTKKLLKLAVQKNGYALKYIPEQLQTIDIIKLALINNILAYPSISVKITTEIRRIAIEANKFSIFYIGSINFELMDLYLSLYDSEITEKDYIDIIHNNIVILPDDKKEFLLLKYDRYR